MNSISARFKELDKYLSMPYRTRRWAMALATIVGLGLAIYCNIENHELHAESLLITLVGASSAGYLGGKIVDGVTKNKLNDVEGDC